MRSYHDEIDGRDEELVAAAKQGDTTAMDHLLRSHYDHIYRVCLRIMGNESDGADATQHALLAVVNGLSRFDGRSQFSTWSYRVATNAALDELRRRNRRPVPVLDQTDSEPNPVDFERNLVDRLDIGDALPLVPDEFRVPVIMRDQVGMSYEEIAQALQIAPGTVRSRIARGRRRLAQLLGNQTTSSERPSG